VAVPAVFGGLGIFILYRLFQRDRSALTLIIQLLIYGIAIVTFYSITGSQELNIRPNAGTSELMQNLGSLFLDDQPLKIMTIMRSLLEEWVIYMPLVVITIAILRRPPNSDIDYRGLAVLVGGVLLSGAGSFALFFDQKDGAQRFYNVANPLLNVLMIWGVIKLVSQSGDSIKDAFTFKNGLVLICAGLYAIAISLQIFKVVSKNILPAWSTPAYSDQYLNEIKTYILSDDRITIGAAIKGGEDYASSYSWQTAAYTLGYYLAYMEDGAVALNISDYDIPIDPDAELIDRESSLFYRYMKTQKESRVFANVVSSQMQFIKAYDLDFIIASKSTSLPHELREIAQEMITDPISGERFIIVNKSFNHP
jgi:hypothetical protein